MPNHRHTYHRRTGVGISPEGTREGLRARVETSIDDYFERITVELRVTQATVRKAMLKYERLRCDLACRVVEGENLINLATKVGEASVKKAVEFIRTCRPRLYVDCYCEDDHCQSWVLEDEEDENSNEGCFCDSNPLVCNNVTIYGMDENGDAIERTIRGN